MPHFYVPVFTCVIVMLRIKGGYKFSYKNSINTSLGIVKFYLYLFCIINNEVLMLYATFYYCYATLYCSEYPLKMKLTLKDIIYTR
jgi:hypothetical protein